MAPDQDQRGQPQSYAAFLRGINVGGHRKIKMADLRTAFVDLGFENVKPSLPAATSALKRRSLMLTLSAS